VVAALRLLRTHLSLSLVVDALDDSPAKDDSMASTGKPRTTRTKLQREATLRERRFEKAARKQIRKQAQFDQVQLDETNPNAEDSLADTAGPGPESGAGALPE